MPGGPREKATQPQRFIIFFGRHTWAAFGRKSIANKQDMPAFVPIPEHRDAGGADSRGRHGLERPAEVVRVLDRAEPAVAVGVLHL